MKFHRPRSRENSCRRRAASASSVLRKVNKAVIALFRPAYPLRAHVKTSKALQKRHRLMQSFPKTAKSCRFYEAGLFVQRTKMS
jgi:hypothetical protein